MFRMLTKKTIKQFPVITVSGIHMGFLCITIFALYRLCSQLINQSRSVRKTLISADWNNVCISSWETLFVSEQNGLCDAKLQYVYETCKVNGCKNEDGGGDSLSCFQLIYSNFFLRIVVFHVVIYGQPSQNIHIIELRETKSLHLPNWMPEIK